MLLSSSGFHTKTRENIYPYSTLLMLTKDHGDFSSLVNLPGCGVFDPWWIAGRLTAGNNIKDLEKQF